MRPIEMKPGFSILVCSYNGAARLPSTLKHLSLLQCIESFNYEVIVVCNACTDNSMNLMRSISDSWSSKGKLIVMEEAKPGKSHALQKALSNSQFEFVIICDDDNWLDSNYLVTAYNYLLANSQVDMVGGEGQAIADIDLPDWFADAAFYYACSGQAEFEGDITGKRFLWGAGLVARRAVLDKIFQTPLLLTGRKENQLIGGEDDEVCLRAWLLGYKTYYTSELRFRHYMPASRLTREYYSKLRHGFSFQSDIIDSYKRLYEVTRWNKAKRFSSIVGQLLRLAKCKLLPSPIRLKSARNYLYFLTSRQIWADETTTKILNFYKTSLRCEH